MSTTQIASTNIQNALQDIQLTYIHTESPETLTREDQIDLAGLDAEAEQPLEIEQQYRIKEDAPEPTPVEEKRLFRNSRGKH